MDNPANRPHLTDLVRLLGRLLLSLIFLQEGLSLLVDLSRTTVSFSNLGLPAPLTLAVIALQLGAGLSIAAGLFVRPGAVALALFCLATALLFHTSLSNQNELLHFEKDLGIAGGMFVLATSGAGSLSIAHWIRRRSNALPAWLAMLL